MHRCAGELTALDCGCVIERCAVCGAGKSVVKCAVHTPVGHDPRRYYLDKMGGHQDGVPTHAQACAEMVAALVEMKMQLSELVGGRVLEVGAGIGRHAPLFMSLHCDYQALEADPWAAYYINQAYFVRATCATIEQAAYPPQAFATVVAAHCLEHFADPAGALAKIKSWLAPGGRLVVIVPDDTDLGNPDHKWFFTQAAMTHWLGEIGFGDVRSCVKQVVPHEKFLYFAGVA